MLASPLPPPCCRDRDHALRLPAHEADCAASLDAWHALWLVPAVAAVFADRATVVTAWTFVAVAC